jgi:hypothetical protein
MAITIIVDHPEKMQIRARIAKRCEGVRALGERHWREGERGGREERPEGGNLRPEGKRSERLHLGLSSTSHWRALYGESALPLGREKEGEEDAESCRLSDEERAET